MEKKVIMKRHGGFYNSYDEGGIVLSKVMGYKFNPKFHNTGFPSNALIRVCNRLQDKKISYEVWNGDEIIEKYKGVDKVFDKIYKE